MATELNLSSINEKKELLSLPIESKPTKRRCVNLDWLEVHALEPIERALDADYYRSKGYVVHEREFGTRVYKQMFTLDGANGEPLLEIRRAPASTGLKGIHSCNECHVRLVNRTCYYNNAAKDFSDFLSQHGYTVNRISRVDICLDFVLFDKGDDPQAFIRRYFRRKYAKINQARISSHGEDKWNGQEWNSLSWGSKTSPVSTKLYNKTLELYDPKTDTFKKPYIRQAWAYCGMVDDYQRCTLNGEPVTVWRVEFSLRSEVKGWIPIEIDGKERNYQSLHNTLECYFGRDRLLVLFASLAQHYFRFKKYRKNQRKDRCPDKVLFVWSKHEVTYKCARVIDVLSDKAKLFKPWQRLLNMLTEYQQTHGMPDLTKACQLLINKIKDEHFMNDCPSNLGTQEIKILKELLSLRTRDPELDYDTAMTLVKQMLGITDRTISVF